jgi:hypothetical protein
MRAVLRYHEKYHLRNRYLIEMSIFEVSEPRYPLGVKYRLICLDFIKGKRVLMDNHYPKGHHVHLDLEI